MGDPESAIIQLAHRWNWRLVVLFGSSAARGKAGRDVDLAVLPGGPTPTLLEQGRWQAALEELFEPQPVDLLVLSAASSPIIRFQVFRNGRCLFEAEPGLFSREQDRAFFLYADSEIFRRQMREALYGRPTASGN